MNEIMKYTNNDAWNIIELYYKDDYLSRLVRHHLESYNIFIEYQMEKTIEMFNPIKIEGLDDDVLKNNLEINLIFNNLKLYRPEVYDKNGIKKLMFPNESRLRNMTYTSQMKLDLTVIYKLKKTNEIVEKKFNDINIGKIPIMLKSNLDLLKQYNYLLNDDLNECKYDPGGYFIINGSEKIILDQERVAENKIYCFTTNKNNTKNMFVAEINSIPDNISISPKKILIMISNKTNEYGYPIHIQLPKIKQPIPVFILFKALGILKDKEICKIILLSLDNKILLNSLQASVMESSEVNSEIDAINYIMSFVSFNTDSLNETKKEKYINDVLNTELFPHCKTKNQKIYLLGYAINKLINCSLNYIEQDDRDSYINKRIDLTGTLLNNLFRNYFNKFVKDIEKSLLKEIKSLTMNNDIFNLINEGNIPKIFKSTTIENGLKKPLSTGDFSIKNINNNKVGVAQVLNRLSYMSMISHIRKISTPSDKSGKLIPPRKLHGTSWGFIGCYDTPEGHQVGIVKNLSIMTHITIYSNSEVLYDYVNDYIESLDKSINNPNHVKVIINGTWIGIVSDKIDAYKFYCELKEKKIKGIINVYTSIIFDYKKLEIRLCSDAGRLTRPLLIVKNQKLLLTSEIIYKISKGECNWNSLYMCENAVIEYLDPEEQSYNYIAMFHHDLKNDKNYTHCEIHPSTIFSILASCIPFPEHNQSPRNTYQCAMTKQAIGIYMSNYLYRMDKTSHVLIYQTRPLIETRMLKILKMNEIPMGYNVNFAIMTMTGYNQEDSLLINKGSIDRGLFQICTYHTEKDEDKKKIENVKEIRCLPNSSTTRGKKYGNYGKLNKDGYVENNTLIENNDIIIGKVIQLKDNTKYKFEDQSKSYKTNEETFIDKNYSNKNGDGYQFIKVRLRSIRKPVIGDKFCSRSGQKGTLGNIIPEEDMPYTQNGTRPDLIINPHAIPSRMTIAQLKESLLGKVLCEIGILGDGTAFGDLTIDDIRKKLLDLKKNMDGNEIMYDGSTGKQINSDIFMGIVYYHRLKHMVIDKQHSRSTGQMVALTRQPTEGRSKQGGLRIGEMERDAIISHGASSFVKDRLFDVSDKYQVYICNKCGMIAPYNKKYNIHKCNLCDDNIDFSLVNMPYACKLIFQELMTMNIFPRVITEK
uniref:DNA-directed RNA polymerase n=1 Tax=viral metagenome TaxID=1070528 RepID=A0A6C0H5M3_9ZZZZ